MVKTKSAHTKSAEFTRHCFYASTKDGHIYIYTFYTLYTQHSKTHQKHIFLHGEWKTELESTELKWADFVKRKSKCVGCSSSLWFSKQTKILLISANGTKFPWNDSSNGQVVSFCLFVCYICRIVHCFSGIFILWTHALQSDNLLKNALSFLLFDDFFFFWTNTIFKHHFFLTILYPFEFSRVVIFRKHPGV